MGLCAEGWLLWLLAIGSTTPRAALLLICIAAAVCLLVRFAVRIGGTSSAAVLLSVGMTAVVYAPIQRWFPDITFAPPLWIALAVFAGTAAHDDTARLPYQTVPTLFLVGCIREILANGSIWGITLLPMGLSPAFADGVGGWLTAAVLLWCCRLHSPLFRKNRQEIPFAILGGTVALGAVIGLFTASLPLWVALWGALTVGALCFSFLPPQYSTDIVAVAVPLAAWWTHESENRWLPLLFSVGTVAAVWTLTIIVRERRLSPTPSRFAGVPSALTVSAMLYSVVTAF